MRVRRSEWTTRRISSGAEAPPPQLGCTSWRRPFGAALVAAALRAAFVKAVPQGCNGMTNTRICQVLLVAGVLLAAGLLSAASQQAPSTQPQPVFRVGVDAVRIDA